MLTLTREPARIAAPGTFRLPGLDAEFTIGRDAVLAEIPELTRTRHLSVDVESCGKEGRIRYDVKAVITSTRRKSVVFDPRDPPQFRALHTLLNEGHALTFHNSPFDCPILYKIGLLKSSTLADVTDTLIYARMAWPEKFVPNGLGAVASRLLGLTLPDPLPALLKTLNISVARWYAEFDLDTPAYRLMAATDGILTARIREPVRRAALARITEDHPFSTYGVSGSEAERLVEREQVINRSRLPRTCLGVRVDPTYLDAYRARNEVRTGELAGELEREGIRPGNGNDMTLWLDTRDLLPENYPRTPKTGAPSSTAENLLRIGHPLVASFIEYKRIIKIDNDYLSKVMTAADEDGRVHCQENLLAATTGRASVSGDFPYHQTPPGARAALLADPGAHLTSIDWSQIEPVLIANIAGDLRVLEPYEAGRSDLYLAVSEFARIVRKQAKIILLGSLYGEGLGKISRDLGVSLDQARAVQMKVWEAMPKTKAMAGRGGLMMKIAKEHRRVFTLSGRILPIPMGSWPCWDRHDPEDWEAIANCYRCDDKGRQHGVQEHLGVNYPTQGGAYDLLAESLYEIAKQGLADAVYFQMHDELVVDREAAPDIQKIMQTPPDRLVFLAKRTPVLRTDLEDCLGESWHKASDDE